MKAAAPARTAPPRLFSLVRGVLDRYAARGPDDSAEADADPGPLVLAALLAEREGAALHEGVVERWLDQLQVVLQDGSLELGPAGPLAGLAASRETKLRRLRRSLWDQVAGLLPLDRWRAREVSWSDYDLIRGPSAIVLGLTASGRLDGAGAVARRRLAVRCARQLLALCDENELGALRLRRHAGDDRLRFNEGRINTGVAHGVAGIALALRSALGHELVPASRLRVTLGRLSDWLVSSSYVDRSGLRTWPLAGLDGAAPPLDAPPPQAWCYGTPGIAWSLWECGRALGRDDLASFALDAFGTWCARLAPRVDRRGDVAAQLGFCHGAAGTLAIADGFARHARFAPAAKAATELERLLLRELEAVAGDLSLLTGACGILAVLLTRRGASRRWLRPFGLR